MYREIRNVKMVQVHSTAAEVYDVTNIECWLDTKITSFGTNIFGHAYVIRLSYHITST